MPSFGAIVIRARATGMSAVVPDGGINIILRFRSVMGGVNRGFRPENGVNEVVDDRNAHLAASVLADICCC